MQKLFCRIDSPGRQYNPDERSIEGIDLTEQHVIVFCVTIQGERHSNHRDAPLPHSGTRYLMRVQTTTYVDSSSMMDGTSWISARR